MAEREQKILSFMNKMTEQVVSKTNHAEKEVEKRVMQY